MPDTHDTTVPNATDPGAPTPGESTGTWELDVASNRITLSAEVRLGLGLPHEPAAYDYDEFVRHVHPDDRKGLRVALFRSTHGGEPFDYSFRFIRPDGTMGWLHGHGQVQRDASGSPARISGAVREDPPPASPSDPIGAIAGFDSLLVQTTADGCLLIDLEGRILDANPAYCDLLGRARDEVIGKNLREIEDDDEEGIQQRLQWTAVDGQLRYETQHRHRDGSLFDLEVSARHLMIGHHDCVFAVLRPMRERRLAREEARRLNAYLQLLLDSAGEGIYSVDAEGRCTFVNRAAQELLGYSRHELLGKRMESLIHRSEPNDDGQEDSPVSVVLRTGSGVRVDDELIWRKNDTSFPAEYSSYPVMENGVIAGAVVVFRDVTEARSMAMQLEYQATHDALTGLANRREFQIRLDHALLKARHEERSHVLLFLDLDQFKVVNDTSGHAAGDELLRTLADQFKGMIRSGDTLARLGGDEFGLLLESCDLEYGLKLAERIRQAVQEFRFAWEGNNFTIGVSIGVVPITADSLNTAAVLAAADTACYSAKDAGRNRVKVYRPDDTAFMRRQGDMRWIGQLHQALREDQMQLYYQTLRPLTDRAEEGLHIELLLRMKTYNGEFISPSAFLPAAERAGLTPEIDRWVVNRSFAWLSTHATPEKLALCSINLSGHSLSDRDFLDFVIQQFEKHGLDPRRVCFEVTETAAIANLSNARRLFSTLSKMGARFALDDFGTGMSSYGYLKSLPVDFLKIDGSFVKDIATDPIDLALVKSINDIGHVMGKQTIAEFVENEEIFQKVKELDVDFAQGYHIDRARPIESLFGGDEN
jgi:two-component system CheB/CheR fusion protein